MKSFQGLVDHIALDNTYTELRTDYVTDFRENSTFLYNVRFDDESVLVDDRTIVNLGQEGVLQIYKESSIEFKDTFFQVPKKGLVGGTFEA